jgi:GDSL-like lipase/acylhydrolase family protein
MMQGHIVLLGDSVFDNRAYTGGEPEVVEHLRAILPAGYRASMHAVDGATTADLHRQLALIPDDNAHLVVSIGGNDALGHIDLLSTPVRSTAEALTLFGRRVREFESGYRTALRPFVARSSALVVCTIYNGNLPDAQQAAHARLVLMLFNDVILRTAFEHGLGAIDLRLVCTEPADYANAIEPSGRGGEKIARAIAQATGALAPGTASVVTGGS